MNWAVLILLASLNAPPAADPTIWSEFIFPLLNDQSHAPGIVECPNGDLLASWYKGSEGSENDAAVWGSKKKKGAASWSKPYIMADRPGFSDCNTCMSIDFQNRLWLFWPVIVGNSWETCLLSYKVSSDYQDSDAPKWDREGLLLLKPDDFREEALRLLGDRKIKPPRGAIGGPDGQRAKFDDPLYQRLGWAPRCKPTILPSGRMILPLYTDTFAISIMAISDDDGKNWYASKPLIGFGNIQPTVLRRNDGSLVTYMRENGTTGKIRFSESKDEGISWSPVSDTELPNPGAGIDAVRLANGHWVMIYNDSTTSRATLVVSLSKDEGKSWTTTRHLEKHADGRYHYPAIIQGKDGAIHAIYACFIAPEEGDVKLGADGKPLRYIGFGIKHASFPEQWIEAASK